MPEGMARKPATYVALDVTFFSAHIPADGARMTEAADDRPEQRMSTAANTRAIRHIRIADAPGLRP